MNNDYEIRGNVTAIFMNHKGSRIEALIDTIDLERAMEFDGKWYGKWDNTTESFYVHGAHPKFKPMLHRWILRAEKLYQVDHINHDTLDNQRKNLRLATWSQNQQNRKGLAKSNTSGYRGVTWIKSNKKWRAQMKIKGKGIILGDFDNILDAAKAAEQGRIKYMEYYIAN